MKNPHNRIKLLMEHIEVYTSNVYHKARGSSGKYPFKNKVKYYEYNDNIGKITMEYCNLKRDMERKNSS